MYDLASQLVASPFDWTYTSALSTCLRFTVVWSKNLRRFLCASSASFWLQFASYLLSFSMCNESLVRVSTACSFIGVLLYAAVVLQVPGFLLPNFLVYTGCFGDRCGNVKLLSVPRIIDCYLRPLSVFLASRPTRRQEASAVTVKCPSFSPGPSPVFLRPTLRASQREALEKTKTECFSFGTAFCLCYSVSCPQPDAFL